MADLNHLQSLLDSEAKSLHVPGAAVGVLFDGADHILTTGVTSVDTPAPVTGDTLFQIGSTTKTVTATSIMHLVERGRRSPPTRGVPSAASFETTRVRSRSCTWAAGRPGGSAESSVRPPVALPRRRPVRPTLPRRPARPTPRRARPNRRLPGPGKLQRSTRRSGRRTTCTSS
ncbi:serine hydrolase [Microtetraspora glauca]|uniref:Serine hydrolase n=1 Tax=Microtetraspora glauca TaxID=1996 RepID=A0ABV3GST6_MICGL